MDPSARWTELLSGPDEAVPLDEAALLIAAHDHPGLDLGAQLSRLDRLADSVHGDGVDAVNELLFGRMMITGNTAEYSDPANSDLDRVLDRALGIPISLSVLLIEVSRRRGLRLEGVGMPGHFLVRDRDHPETLIDAFSGGRRLDDAACRRLFSDIVGPGPALHPAMLAPSGARQILARMLANLDRSFRSRGDRQGLEWVTCLRVAIPDQSPETLVEAAGTLADVGRYDRAAALLWGVAESDGLADETAERLRSRATAMQARLN